MRLACLLSVFLFGLSALAAEPQLTIYNQNFAVVREIIQLDLKTGRNEVQFSGATAHLEPDSVILRDSAGRIALQVLEQNYRNDPISQDLLLSLFEGQSVQFEIKDNIGTRRVEGKILRSGYMPGYGAPQSYQTPTSPLIEMEGKLRFGLPGIPVFPLLPADTILQPTLHWILNSAQPGPVKAELSYVTGGMSWHADYNLVAKEGSEKLNLTGWVTMGNQSGKQFDGARIQLMAGDVRKIQPQLGGAGGGGVVGGIAGGTPMAQPPVTERTFDDYHLYTLDNPTSLRDRENKQVEFVQAANITGIRKYLYDGVAIDARQYQYASPENIRQSPDYGTQSNSKVWIRREFENTKGNQLGLPLPQGRIRFYVQDDKGRLQFVGENTIDHTPRGERVSIATGNAFDLIGARRRVDYRIDNSRRELDESFEITLRNQKSEAVEIEIAEHLYRGQNWEIQTPSDSFRKVNSNLINFTVKLKPEEERKVTYKVHYTW